MAADWSIQRLNVGVTGLGDVEQIFDAAEYRFVA